MKRFATISVSFFILILIFHHAHSQQTPIFGQYFLNPYLFNPAAAGADADAKAFFLYRLQWAEIEGAPETQVFTVDGRLAKERIGLGVTFMNDVSNIIGTTSGAITTNYQVSLTHEQFWTFGMSFVGQQNKIFFDRVRADDLSDPNLLSNGQRRTIFEINSGIRYQWKDLELGFAVNQLLQNQARHENDALFQSVKYSNVRHYFTSLSYKVQVSPDWSLRGLGLVRTVQGISSQYDVNIIAGYQQHFWGSMVYRHEIGVGFAVGLELADRFIFSYQNELPTTDLSIIGGTSHEFVLGVRLQKQATSVISNLDDPDNDYIRTLNEQYAHQQEMFDSLAQQNQELNAIIEQFRSTMDSQDEQVAEMMGDFEAFKGDIDVFNEALEKVDGQEDLRYYLILGVFSQLENAELFRELLKGDAAMNTQVVPGNEEGTWYLIYVSELKR